MIFNSLEFLLFLPIVLILYFFTKDKYRWLLLLGSSYLFYMFWRWDFIFLILFSTVIDYWVALKISKSDSQKIKKRFLFLSLIVNLGFLFSFKYLFFFTDSFNHLFTYFNTGYQLPVIKLILPVGISFYTFQTLSYTIDVYNGRTKAEHSFGRFALFVCYWPQLVAGPIERSHHLLPELRKKFVFNKENTIQGITQMAYGFFKKVVVADRLAVYVNSTYEHMDNLPSVSLMLGAFFFAVQIYADFSGYSDIAIGVSRIMEIELMDNFRRPYLSKSITEFWQRWHISLSSWFRDYVYIPMGGNRVVKWRWYYNLLITFLISGLWHGANWTFVIWGGLHGILLIMAKRFQNTFSKIKSYTSKIGVPKLYGILQIVIINIVVIFAWIFFRSENVQTAFKYIAKIFEFNMHFSLSQLCVYQGPFNLLLSLTAVTLLFASYLLPYNLKVKHPRILIVSLIMITLIIGKGGNNEFIYFQF